MQRRFVAAAWIAGATVPLLMGTVFVFGCCVLPFHQVVHQLMPLCEMATDVMRGEHEHDAPPQTPAREKEEPRARGQVAEGRAQKIVVSPALCPLRSALPRASASYRSFITLGAVRCDQDVGLNVLVDTFRI